MDKIYRDIAKIQILPMDKKEAFENQSIQKVQTDFFIKQLNKESVYLYKKSGIAVNGKVLILFQYDSHVIAAGVLYERGVLDSNEVEYKEGFRGKLIFEKDSIRIFVPISAEELKTYFPEFKNFGNYKPILNTKCITQDFIMRIGYGSEILNVESFNNSCDTIYYPTDTNILAEEKVKKEELAKEYGNWKNRLHSIMKKKLKDRIVESWNGNSFSRRGEEYGYGKEDMGSKVNNFVVMINCSDNMGSAKFENVLLEIEKGLKKTISYLVKLKISVLGWGDIDLLESKKIYQLFKENINKNTFYSFASKLPSVSQNYIVPAITFIKSRIRKPDLVFLLTDATFADDMTTQYAKMAKIYVLNNHSEIFWILPEVVDVALKTSILEIDPSALKEERVIFAVGADTIDDL